MRDLVVEDVHILFPDREDHLARWVETGHWYEWSVLLEIERHMKPGARMVDVGAHLGNHSLYFATHVEASSVLAIEPHPWTYQTLCETIQLNGLEDQIEPVQALIHPTWKTASLDFSEDMDAPWMRTMLPVITEGGDTPCMTLNEALEPGCDVVKIDVEEMGSEVLASGVEMLKQHGPMVAIEAQGDEIRRVERILNPIGYVNLGQFQEHGTPTWIWVCDGSERISPRSRRM